MQPIDSVRLSHRVLREFALGWRGRSPCIRDEPVGTKAHPFLSKKMTIMRPSTRRRSLGAWS